MALCLPSTPSAGQDARHGEPVVRAERAGGPISVDGRLDDEPWRAAPAARAFLQRDPDEGEPATEATELRVLYDDSALYVGEIGRASCRERVYDDV